VSGRKLLVKISIYLVTIKQLFSTLKKKSLKLLVLDDLLISLDMSHRMKLLNILKNCHVLI